MRLSGTKDDLDGWLYLLDKLGEKSFVKIIEKSSPYKNRGDSEIYRVYVKAEFIDMEG